MKDMEMDAAERKNGIELLKSKFEGVRVLGPVRKETQVEISISDSFKLGVKPPVRESGKLEELDKYLLNKVRTFNRLSVFNVQAGDDSFC